MSVSVADLHPKGKKLVRAATRQGWSARPRPTRHGAVGVELHAPPPHISIMVIVPPLRQWNDGVLRSLEGKIKRYGRS